MGDLLNVLIVEALESGRDVASHVIVTDIGKANRANPDQFKSALMSRLESWKRMVVEDGGTNELYDLESRPFELESLFCSPGTRETPADLRQLMKMR